VSFSLLLFLTLLNSTFICADEAAPAGDVQPSVELLVRQMRVRSFSSLNSIRGQIEVQLSVSNRTEKSLELGQSDFKFTFDGKSGSVNVAITDPLLTGRKSLPAGAQATGWIALNLQHPSPTEPKLLLSFQKDDLAASVSLNDALRETAKVSTTLIGPEDCLAVIRLKRSIDQMSIWLLHTEFHRLEKMGIQRVVIVPQAQGPNDGTHNGSVSAISTWLASASLAHADAQVRTQPTVRSPVQFRELYAVQDSMRSSRTYGVISSVFQPDEEHAIAVALRSVYDNVSVEQAMRDLNEKHVGVQRVAFESNVDRFTDDQLRLVVKQSAKESAAFQAMVAENLYRVASPFGVEALEMMVHSETAGVSKAAVGSLVKSASPAAAAALQKLWNEQQNSPTLIQQIVEAVIAAKDHRHANLLSEFAESQLDQFTGGKPEDPAAIPKPDPTAEHPKAKSSVSTTQRTVVTSPDTRMLQSILNFLREQNDVSFAEIAERRLLKIEDPRVQDYVFAYVIAVSQSDLSELARSYIALRLPEHDSGDDTDRQKSSTLNLTDRQRADFERRYSARGGSARSRITSHLISMVKKFPDQSYTPRLLELSDSRAVSSSIHRDAFQAALLCATDQQLQNVIDNFEGLDANHRRVLLTQLSTLRHPQFFELAEDCLQGDDSSVSGTLSILRNSQSPEAMALMLKKLESLRMKAEEEFARNEKVDHTLQRMIGRFVDQIGGHSHQYVHPEARRMMNRLRRSPIPALEEMARQSMIRGNVFIPQPQRIRIAKAFDLQKEDKYDESRKIFEELLQDDPFYTVGYTALASLDLRDGEAKQAMEHLKIADAMNPEDVHTESMIALADIRLGNVKKGIAFAETLLESIPEESSSLRTDTLYNTACTYGRAIEAEKDETIRKKYESRGIELLLDCVNRKNGFSDRRHALADPDLNVFHEHAQWAAILKKIGENEEAEANVRP